MRSSQFIILPMRKVISSHVTDILSSSRETCLNPTSYQLGVMTFSCLCMINKICIWILVISPVGLLSPVRWRILKISLSCLCRNLTICSFLILMRSSRSQACTPHGPSMATKYQATYPKQILIFVHFQLCQICLILKNRQLLMINYLKSMRTNSSEVNFFVFTFHIRKRI